MDETHLCSQWQLSMKCGSSQEEVQVNIPKLYSVPAQDLNSPVLVFEENPGLCKSWQGKQFVLSVKDQCTECPVCFHYQTIRQSAETNLPTITMACRTKLIHVTVSIGKS
jgi:hypothetical protein